MLIGMNPSSSSAPGTGSGGTADSFDVTAPDFEVRVMKASLDRPVIIDFWAPWCGPCKQLMPILEQAVLARKGRVALAKVNVDSAPELAAAFRVQSVPTVIAFYRGQPVGGFAGARPARDIEHLLDQVIALHNQNKPEALDIPGVLTEAAALLESGDLGGAQELYAAVLSQDATQVEAYIGMVRVMIAAGEIDRADGLVAGAPEAIAKDSKFAAARTALDLAKNAAKALDAAADIDRRLQADPLNPALLYEAAEAAYAAGEKDKAVDHLITILRHRRDSEDGKAKTLLLKFFESWGFKDPASVTGRRKLSSLLFS